MCLQIKKGDKSYKKNMGNFQNMGEISRIKNFNMLLFLHQFGLIFLGGEVQELLLRNCLRRKGFVWFPSLSSYQGRDLFIPRSLGRSPTTFEFGIPKKVTKNCQAVILQTDLRVCVCVCDSFLRILCLFG